MSTEIADPNRVSVAFIKYYYNLLNSNEDKLYQLYSKDAVLRHNLHSEPFSSNTKNVVGNDSIKEHWKSSELAGAKVMIQSIDSTPSYNNSILIIAAGELALKSADEFNDDQPSYKFVQTFVLVPTKGVFDVYNDVLTFIPDVDADYDVEEQSEETKDVPEENDTVKEAIPVEEVKADEPVIEDKDTEDNIQVPPTVDVSTTTFESAIETTPIPSAEDKEKEEVFSPKSTKESTPETAAEEEEQQEQEEDPEKKSSEEPTVAAPVEESKEKVKSEDPTATPSEEPTPTPSEELKKSPAPTTPASSDEIKPAAAPKPFTWASLAAVGGTKNTSVAKVPTGSPQVVIANGSKAAKPANGSSPNNFQGEFKKVTSRKNKRDFKKEAEEEEFIEGRGDIKAKTKFTNHAGQEVYPVYIKNVDASIKDADLIGVLEQKFGKVDSCKIDRFVALVDFVKKEAQTESIKTHKVRVKDLEIRIEHRIKKEDKPNFSKNKNKKKNNKHHTGNGFTGENDGFKRVERK